LSQIGYSYREVSSASIFQIGENITVAIKEISGQEVRVSIDAPPETKILRDKAIRKEKS